MVAIIRTDVLDMMSLLLLMVNYLQLPITYNEDVMVIGAINY